jgi:hypothetical protein
MGNRDQRQMVQVNSPKSEIEITTNGACASKFAKIEMVKVNSSKWEIEINDKWSSKFAKIEMVKVNSSKWEIEITTTNGRQMVK